MYYNIGSNNIWRTIYESTHETYFKEVPLFPDEFLEQCKNNLKMKQNVPYDIKFTINIEDILGSQVVIIRHKT